MVPERTVFCLGIGGIGVSAIAQWLRACGATVTGADREQSPMTEALERVGIPVQIPEPAVLPSACDLVVYSDAVPETHPLRREAAVRKIRTRSYADLLGELTQGHRTVAVAGSHGKSTTTALLGLLLEALGADPTVVVGSRVPQWEQATGDRRQAVGNFRLGQSDLAVVEADEYRGHFLSLAPTALVITSLDHDHVDAFPTAEEYEAAFVQLLDRVRPHGTVVLCLADPRLVPFRSRVRADVTVRAYVLSDDPHAADVVVSHPAARAGRQEFSLWVQGQAWGPQALSVPGDHVVLNAAGAIAAAIPFGLTPEAVSRGLSSFRGIWRRFEAVGTLEGAPLISDYAHHPTELRALAAAARQWYRDRRLVIAFQPHQHARSRAFAPAFIEALTLFDAVILADVYGVAGREESAPVSSRDWVLALKDRGGAAVYAPSLDEVARAIRNTVRAHDVVFIVGAGDIDLVARRLASLVTLQ